MLFACRYFLTFSEHMYKLPGWARYCAVGAPKRGDCKRPRLSQRDETDSSLGLPREEELGPPQSALRAADSDLLIRWVQTPKSASAEQSRRYPSGPEPSVFVGQRIPMAPLRTCRSSGVFGHSVHPGF